MPDPCAHPRKLRFPLSVFASLAVFAAQNPLQQVSSFSLSPCPEKFPAFRLPLSSTQNAAMWSKRVDHLASSPTIVQHFPP
jgi:hypothetical protein